MNAKILLVVVVASGFAAVVADGQSAIKAKDLEKLVEHSEKSVIGEDAVKVAVGGKAKEGGVATKEDVRALTSKAQTTLPPTSKAPTTLPPTSKAPTTLPPTSKAPTTHAPTSKAPTTLPPTSKAPTTHAPTSKAPTTHAPTSQAPTTHAPTSKAPTTHAPTTHQPTTTEAPPTTNTPDVPPGKPGLNKFTGKNATTGKICISGQMRLALVFNYTTVSGGSKPAHVNVPSVGDVQVDCSADKIVAIFRWEWNGKQWKVKAKWQRATDAKKYIVGMLKFVVPTDAAILPHVKVDQPGLSYSNANMSLFATDLGRAYECQSPLAVRVTPRAQVSFSHVLFQAFQLPGGDSPYSKEHNVCAADGGGPASKSSLVPILVGCILAALIVIVIVAYFIASRYRQYHGYEQL